MNVKMKFKHLAQTSSLYLKNPFFLSLPPRAMVHSMLPFCANELPTIARVFAEQGSIFVTCHVMGLMSILGSKFPHWLGPSISFSIGEASLWLFHCG